MNGKSEQALGQHCFGNLQETGNIRACHKVVAEAVFFSGFCAVVMNGLHDILELLVNFLGTPAVTHAVLGHFECGYRNTAGVDCLCRSDDHAVFLQECDSLVAGRHVGEFEVVFRTVGNDLLCFFHSDFVLCCAGDVDIALDAPRLFALVEFETELVRIHLDVGIAACTDLKQVVQLFLGVDAVRIIDITVMAGDGDDLAAKLCDLGGCAPCNVTVAGENEG